MSRPARLLAAAALAMASLVTAATLAMTEASAAPTPTPVPTTASVIDVVCRPPSYNLTTFNPPLTLVNQPTAISATTKYSPCSAPAVSSLTSGYTIKNLTLNDDCTMVLLTFNTVTTITWNNGQTTTFSAVRSATISGTTLIVSFHGTVTAGLFTGSTVDQVFTADATDLINCLNGNGRLPQLYSQVDLKIYH